MRPQHQAYLIKSNRISSKHWMHHVDTDKTHWEKDRWELRKNARSNTEYSSTDTYFPSLKPSKKDEQDTQETAGKARTNS